MSGLIFEGALENLSEIQVKFVTDVLEKRGYTNGKVVAEPVGKKGDNYVANVLRLTVEGSNGDVFKTVVKVAPKIPVVRQMMTIVKLFANEHNMYAEVLPKLTEQEELAGIPRNERYKYPIWYGSLIEEPNEIILLEDLKELNFAILDRMESLSNDSVTLAIKELAKLHSLSYVLKHKNPEIYNNLKLKLNNPWLDMNMVESSKEFYGQLENDILEILDKEKHKNIVKGSMTTMMDTFAKFNKLDASASSKSSIIQQGDCWTNNIMFKLENGKLAECIFIDYQLSKESNPAADILYLTLNCTDYETRAKYFHDWIDCYHHTLDDYLNYFGLKASFIYPRDQLDADLRRHGRPGLGIAFMLSSILVRESKDTIDIKGDPDLFSEGIEKAGEKFRLIHMNKETLSRFKTKCEGLVESVVEFGLV